MFNFRVTRLQVREVTPEGVPIKSTTIEALRANRAVYPQFKRSYGLSPAAKFVLAGCPISAFAGLMKSIATVALLLVLAVLQPNPAVAAERWSWPLSGHEVGRAFDLPANPYGAGNRGVDLAGEIGETVRSVAPGVVSYVGTINHVRIVVVDHGAERSTYQPVAASVAVGDAISAGQSIGTLLATGGHCPGSVCLHLGRKAGDRYLDPLALMSTTAQIRLINSEGPLPKPPFTGSGALRRPVGGTITSPYGMRVHPITGVRKLHDGTDFGVACGTPVHAAASGVVIGRAYNSAYGNRVILQHSDGITTSYNHLSRQSVAVGDRVGVGTVVGMVGATGLATGCHLHFMVKRDGTSVNPMKIF